MRESDIRKKKLERMRRNKMMRENEEIENDQRMKVINEKVISNFFFFRKKISKNIENNILLFSLTLF